MKPGPFSSPSSPFQTDSTTTNMHASHRLQHQAPGPFRGGLCTSRQLPKLPVLNARQQTRAVAMPEAEQEVQPEATPLTFDLACPICQSQRFSLVSMPDRPTGLSCPRCSRTFNSSPTYVDLTLTSGVQSKVYQQASWNGTELFRNPLVSYAYERGWRQRFAWAGFPGVDKEFQMAMDYMQPAQGKVIVDMSCGSGLFTRRFARSGIFPGVIAADFSESMLKQAKAYIQEDDKSTGSKSTGSSATSAPIILLRADVGRLPFPTGSVAAIHAGAAIHCWPNPEAALAEISRVLAPGGVFVASTFLLAGAELGAIIGDDVVRPFTQIESQLTRSQMRYWEEAELRDLCTGVGLQDFTRHRSRRFIMFAATKPLLPPPMTATIEE